MKWTLHEIHNQADDMLLFDHTLDLEDQLQERDSQVLAASPARAKGYLVPRQGDTIMHAQVDLEITLPSSRTLEPVTLPMTIDVRERYVLPSQDTRGQDYEEVTIVLDEEAIDLSEVAIEAILSNIPLKVVGPDEGEADLPQGNHWSVITEEAYKAAQDKAKEDTVDPRFESLRALLEENENE